MPIENRDLEPGTVLTARYKKQHRTCAVVQTDAGLRYKLDDGTEHKSPSSAGKAVTGGACNGCPCEIRLHTGMRNRPRPSLSSASVREPLSLQ